MKVTIALVGLVVIACATSDHEQDRTPVPTQQPAALTSTPSPTAAEPAAVAPTPDPTVPSAAAPTRGAVRTIAGIDFVMVEGPADLRIDAAIASSDILAIGALATSDIDAVQRDFSRPFNERPLVYVLATNETYARGLEGIFGYPSATAVFVAENSVSFFEPSLPAIAVNWQAVADRRPITALRHELTHRITLDACAPRCDLVPAWLNEGQARLTEAFAGGPGGWRHLRVRYEAASMAATDTLIPLHLLVSQLSWNSLTDWAGYYKYQQAARATELLREDVGGPAPIARVYERLRRGETLARAYEALTGRSFDDFVAGLPSRMRSGLPQGPGLVTLPGDLDSAAPAYLLYGFRPSTTVTLTVSGPRDSESWSLKVSPFGALFDALAPTRASGGYIISVQHPGGVLTAAVHKRTAGAPGDSR